MTQFESKEDFAEAMMTFRYLHPPKVKKKPGIKSKYDLEEVKRMRLEGVPVAEIAKKYGVPTHAIANFISRNGISAPKTKYDLEDVKRLRESGATLAEISEKYGVTEKAVKSYMNRNGIRLGKEKEDERIQER